MNFSSFFSFFCRTCIRPALFDTLRDESEAAKTNKKGSGQQERLDHGHVTRTTQLALVIFITHGSWTFRESPTTSLSSSSDSSAASSLPSRAHEIDFNGMKLVHVSQNVNYSMKRCVIYFISKLFCY
jgi:hypothetical protein